ncbi:MAG: response regulator [Roseobacter sp.]
MNKRRRTVAVVDDDPAVCRALRRLVLSLDHDVLSFSSGEALLSGSGVEIPTHILLDLHLPGLRGPDLLKRIRDHLAHVRILVVTGRDIPGAREDCLAAGANAYSTKPLKLSDLRHFLDTH